MINAQGTYEAHSTEPGTALLLAAAPAGKGCLIDAAAVLPTLAAVPPSALTGTSAATVVELADPLDPQAVLTRIRTAAALPGPLHLYVTGQLHLDHRQRLLHFALARTTPSTLRYTALPWHWLTGELALRRPHTTTVVLDLVTDAAAWQHVRDGGLGLGHGVRLYGRVCPPPPRRTVLTPAYLRACADIWRSGERPTRAALHDAASLHTGPPNALFLAQDTQYPPSTPVQGPVGGAPTGQVPVGEMPVGQAPVGQAPVVQPRAASTQPGPAQAQPARPQAQPAPAVQASAAPAQAQSAYAQAAQAPAVPAQTGGSQAAPAQAAPVQAAPVQPAPGRPARPQAAHAPAQPGYAQAAPAQAVQAPSVNAQVAPAPTSASQPTPAPAAPAQAPAQAAPAQPARTAPHRTVSPRAVPRPAPRTTAAARPADGGDPHPALLAAAQAGRHGEASAIAAMWESEALRTHGAGSPQAIHWLEVRADLARLAQDPPRSCELWTAVAQARLARGEARTDEDVEAAVDRAHHQWEQVADPARARSQAGALRELRRQVPGRRPGALEAIQHRLEALGAAPRTR
ncbi:hypothetical protein OKJ48_40985 [Streptomyces kunmingensis]|uniref:Uncharacterized protein n=1 Tax=Streptomyces kunmingensis TaxID=68225 RepID=A0ABU6CPF0_9ACTN|nr:hypothetical protein [Streptomyces kunmingensis]MEB3966562.1 hypothetical protein [Streptomyces kunmingensis]